VSEALREAQRRSIGDVRARWHGDLDDVEIAGPVIFVANEFFDALPIRQFVRAADGWRERCVGLDASGGLAFGAAPDVVDERLIPERLRGAEVGTVVEISPARSGVAEAIGARLAEFGGGALLIDYGYCGPAAGDTLQAVKAHAYADVLVEPGTADLTSHVDFAALAKALVEGGARIHGPASQSAFLNRLGAFERTERLKRSATAAQAAQLDSAYRRLTAPEAMGSLFKVLCAVSPASLQPAGFVDA
jgi:NADH dehydrogenase [ubiquinone] 1 alpha subcomplex assembly factor 7